MESTYLNFSEDFSQLNFEEAFQSIFNKYQEEEIIEENDEINGSFRYFPLNEPVLFSNIFSIINFTKDFDKKVNISKTKKQKISKKKIKEKIL